MYCTQCGQQLGEESKFCSLCGKATGEQAAPPAPRQRLLRVRQGKKIAGVCSGFARYLGMDVTLVRIVWLVTALTAGVGFIAYIVGWIAMPYDDTPVYSHPDANRYPVANG
jgi:phage shock protein C